MRRLVLQQSDRDLAKIVWDYMRYEQPIEKTDLIFVLGSDDVRIADRAAELYQAGYAPAILVSGDSGSTGKFFDRSEAEMLEQRMVKLGIPPSVIIKEEHATNTGENIIFGYKMIVELGLRASSILLVQKPFMLRRTYATFMQQWPADPKPRIITTTIKASFDEYTSDARYDFSHTVNTMVGDLQRVMLYPKKGFQITQDIPPDVLDAYNELIRRGYTKHLL